MITVQPNSQENIPPGTSVSFTITAIGYNPIYKWRKDEMDIPGVNSDTYTIHSVQESDEGNYLCVVSNDVGSVTSAAANLTVGKPHINTSSNVISCMDKEHLLKHFLFHEGTSLLVGLFVMFIPSLPPFCAIKHSMQSSMKRHSCD